MKILRILSITFGLASIHSTVAFAGGTKVLIVRHAEKNPNSTTSDPNLSFKGQERAKTLSNIALDNEVVATFASEYKRTKQTVAPAASELALDTIVVGARHPNNLAQIILDQFEEQTVLVAGHSNTVPWIIRALGGPAIDPIPEDEFDRMYIVTIDENVHVEEVEYGAISPSEY